MNDEYSFIRYLASKKSVDDRALNGYVWKQFVQSLPEQTAEKPLRVLEIGSGIGTMIERLISWEALNFADYTAIDQQPDNIAHTINRLSIWGGQNSYPLSIQDENHLLFQGANLKISLSLEAVDLFDFIHRERPRQKWDLIVAHAFLDLVNIPETLPKIFDLLAKDGLFYFTINYDGLTLFEPEIDPDFDQQIQHLYNQTMDQRIVAGKPSGDSKTGRHLFNQLRIAGAQLLAAGASDWVVYPGANGYHKDEAFFLHFITHTIQQALRDDPNLNGQQFHHWIDERHAQIEQNKLVYIAHQMDFLGKLK